MSDSTLQNSPKTETSEYVINGVTKHKVTPIPPERYRDNGGAPLNNGKSNGRVRTAAHHPQAAESVIPPDAGARIPIPIRNEPDTDRVMGSMGVGMLDAAPERLRAAIPDVMAPEAVPDTAFPPPETVESKVNRLRPRRLMMQLRFLYTLFFALWLFGRLVFWQVYVARWFPEFVNSRNTPRWRKYAREFREFAIRMGGVQIKAGQFASTRADVLPEEVLAELAGLQDKVPTIPFKRIAQVLRDELGDLDAAFEHIDPEPIAAASLGQVHRADLHTGEKVVIKVQRPGVREIVYTDMAALFIVGKVAMRFSFVNKRVDTGIIIEEFGRVLLEEISYEKEARNAKRFAEMFAADQRVYVPRIYDRHSTDRVLVMEDVTSIKIDDYERLAAAGIDRAEVARRVMDTYMQQIFEDRFFHADPHPGNLFVYPLPVENEEQYIGKTGRPFYLIFVDFGMTATLNPGIVRGLLNTMTAVITRDSKKLVRSYQELGFLLPSADLRRIEEATDVVFNQVWGMSMTDMASLDFEVVDQIGKEFNDLLYDMPFRVPQDFVYLGRTVAILTGIATALDPAYNPWQEIQDRVQHLITDDADENIFNEFGKIIEEAFNEIVAGGPQGFIAVVERFLRQFQRVNRTELLLQKIVDGDIQLETKMSAQEKRQLQRIELQGQRTSRMMIVGSLLICATLLYTNGDSQLALAAVGGAGVVWVSSWFLSI